MSGSKTGRKLKFGRRALDSIANVRFPDFFLGMTASVFHWTRAHKNIARQAAIWLYLGCLNRRMEQNWFCGGWPVMLNCDGCGYETMPDAYFLFGPCARRRISVHCQDSGNGI
jgi:hypothetical protein